MRWGFHQGLTVSGRWEVFHLQCRAGAQKVEVMGLQEVRSRICVPSPRLAPNHPAPTSSSVLFSLLAWGARWVGGVEYGQAHHLACVRL